MCPHPDANPVGVFAQSPPQRDAAAALAIQFGLPAQRTQPYALCVTEYRVELREFADHRAKPICIDFSDVNTKPGPGASKRQPIARAVGLPRAEATLRVLDMTAGFGGDAWLLAALGCEVTMVERSPVVAALLADGLQRAAVVAPAVAARLQLLHCDAGAVDIDHWRQCTDVVYLDPMFPPRDKAALEKRPMRVLRELVGRDDDAAELFALARQIAQKRIVIKRPRHAPPLVIDPPPVATHEGKAMRYDVYRA